MPPGMNASMNGFANPDNGTNLLSVLINLAFGFIAGLMVFIGPKEVLVYGSHLATELIKLSGYGQQMAAFGFATVAAPYIVIGPIIAMVAKQLSSVRSLKSFAYFIAAVLAGCAAVYFSQGYFSALMK